MAHHHRTNARVNPMTFNNISSHDLKLGVRFQSELPGYITGIRFYKGIGNTGTQFLLTTLMRLGWRGRAAMLETLIRATSRVAAAGFRRQCFRARLVSTITSVSRQGTFIGVKFCVAAVLRQSRE